VRVALLGADMSANPGRNEDDCAPFTGNEVAHEVRWPGQDGGAAAPAAPAPAAPAPAPGELVRLRVRAQHARLYALAAAEPGERPLYHRFTELNPQRNHLPIAR
jgi:hypothetical protein